MTTAADAETRERADRELFDAIGMDYAQKDIVASTRVARRSILLRAVLPMVAEAGSLGTVVDVGCGPGSQAIYLAGSYERYIGIDQAQSMVDIGNGLTERMGNVEFQCANFKSAPLPPGTADTVMFINVLHHMTDLDTVFETARRIAKPGARVIALEPQSGNPLVQGLRWVRTKVDSGYSADQHFFAAEEFRAILDGAGLRDIDVRFQSYLTQPFATVVLSPQFLFDPLSRLATALEPAVERLCAGPLARLSWLICAHARFP